MKDRVSLDCDGTVDDVSLECTGLHIENLGERIWIAAYRADGDRFTFEVSAHPKESHPVCRMVTISVA